MNKQLKPVYNFVYRNKGILFGILALTTVALILNYTLKKEKFGNCDNQSAGKGDMPDNAAEACKKISSRAEEIKAELEGASGIVDSFFAFLSPKNYKAGDNKTSSLMRNIINTNLSKCEIQKISNSCNNTIASVQSNIIDATKCDYCQKHGCEISGNIQRNISNIDQSCTLRLAIKALSEKTNSVDAQAAAKVLQETEGLLSGENEIEMENCNVVSKDLSSKEYFENRNECLNELTSTQENISKPCGPFMDNIQENEFKAVQECLGATVKEKEDKVTDETVLKSETSVDQFSKGLDMAASLSFLASVVLVISSSALIGGILFYVSEQEIELE